MHFTRTAKSLGCHERTFIRPHHGIIMKFLAFFTQFFSFRMVIPMAVDPDHLCQALFFHLTPYFGIL